MKRALIVITLTAANLGILLAEKEHNGRKPKGLAVAFFDEVRLRDNFGGDSKWRDFNYFYPTIHEIAARDFPDVEFRILRRGELLSLYDGTHLNVQNMDPDIGFVLSTPGKKHRVLTGVQTDRDFACAASTFFQRTTPACPR